MSNNSDLSHDKYIVDGKEFIPTIIEKRFLNKIKDPKTPALVKEAGLRQLSSTPNSNFRDEHLEKLKKIIILINKYI